LRCRTNPVLQENADEKYRVPRDSLGLGPQAGTFARAIARKAALAPGAMYGCRIRQQSAAGAWSDGSRWHQAFIIDKE
jgi:hypothetical protein